MVIKVNTVELEKKANRMEESLNSFTHNINSLYTDCLYKVGDSWKSTDSYYYIDGLSDYLGDLEELSGTIQDYIVFLRCAVKQYEDTVYNNMTKALD